MTTDSFYCDPNAFPAIEFSPQDQKQPRQHQHHHHQARHEKNILPSTGPAPAAKTKSSKLEIDAEDAKIIEKINYEPVRYLHNGPFSRIYVVKDEDGREFIAKVESRHEIKKTLGLEARIYQTCGHESGFARVYRCAEMAGTRAIIMQKLGTDLSRIRRTLPNERLSTADALKISLTAFCRIWKLHEHGWLHRDIKPSNFVIGMPPADSEVYIVDFGLARPITNQQRPDGTCPMVGTLPYMPLCSHYKIDYQPKDDLESWYYMCVMLFTGTLPWLHLLESPGMVGDYKRYFRNLRPHVGLPQLFGAIFETILNAGNRVNHHRIWALLKSANADLGDEKLIEPCAWMRDPNIVVRALQLPPAY